MLFYYQHVAPPLRDQRALQPAWHHWHLYRLPAAFAALGIFLPLIAVVALGITFDASSLFQALALPLWSPRQMHCLVCHEHTHRLLLPAVLQFVCAQSNSVFVELDRRFSNFHGVSPRPGVPHLPKSLPLHRLCFSHRRLSHGRCSLLAT